MAACVRYLEKGYMRGAKPWQIVLMVVAVLAVVATSVYSFSNSKDLGLAREFPMVDVVTGDRFLVKLPKSGSIMIPTKHPDTGAMTLVPCFQDEAGTWKVAERYAAPLGSNKKLKENSAVDFKAFTVKVSDKEVRTIVGE